MGLAHASRSQQYLVSLGASHASTLRAWSLHFSGGLARATTQRPKHEDGSYYYRVVDGNLKGKPSANGLLVNGRKLQAHDLRNEDEIVFGPQVKAVYYLLKQDVMATIPPDEFDITLISPGMIGEPEDSP